MANSSFDRASRAEQGRGAGRSLRVSFRDSGARQGSLADAAKAHRAADLTRAKAEKHYATHRNAWVAKAYTKLLLKSAPTFTLTPPGIASDPKATLLARAGREVAQRYAQRLARIEQARKNLLGSSALRKSRDLQWGGKSPANSARVTAPSARASQSRDQRTLNAKVDTAQDRARRRAEAHLVKHQDRWTGKRYDQLTARFGLKSGTAPKWSTPHITDIAMEIANRDVKAKHEARLQRIDQACERMRVTGKVRESRPLGRNLALGR